MQNRIFKNLHVVRNRAKNPTCFAKQGQKPRALCEKGLKLPLSPLSNYIERAWKSRKLVSIIDFKRVGSETRKWGMKGELQHSTTLLKSIDEQCLRTQWRPSCIKQDLLLIFSNTRHCEHVSRKIFKQEGFVIRISQLYEFIQTRPSGIYAVQTLLTRQDFSP